MVRLFICLVRKLEKKWVFKAFVENNRDFIGLVAYALYKYDKSSLADQLRKEGKLEPEIQQQVTNFHDHLLHQPDRIESYKKQALALFSNAFEKQEKSLVDAHKKELQKQKTYIYKKLERFPYIDRDVGERISNWLLEGVKSVLASIVVTALFFGLLVMTTSEETKAKILFSALNQIVDVDSMIKNQDKKTP